MVVSGEAFKLVDWVANAPALAGVIGGALESGHGIDINISAW